MGAFYAIAIALLFFVGCSRPVAVVDRQQIIDISDPKPPLPAPTEPPEPNEPAGGPVVLLPKAPTLVTPARDLIIEFEGFDHRPAWPEGSSGVTVGVGYDCGYYARKIIEHDWNELEDSWPTRLGNVSGATGQRAHALIPQLRDINVSTPIGTRVFDNVDVPREYDNCKRAFPGFENLRATAQGALISLGYNRGYAMSGNSRREMRAIRGLVPKKDYAGIATQLRSMKRIWVGTAIQNGMWRRREAEAKLVETPYAPS